MKLSQFLLIIKANKNIVLVVMAITLLTAVVVELQLPKKYIAKTTLLLNYKGVDPVTGIALPAQLMPGFMATQVDVIKSNNVTLDVINRLNLTEIPSVKKEFAEAENKSQVSINEWLTERLKKKLVVSPSKESSVVALEYEGVDPSFAAAMANAYAESYIATSLRLKIDPALKASQYLSEQSKILHDNLKNAQDKLSTYQLEHGLTSVQDTYDVENSKLHDLSAQYSLMQTQSIDANSRGVDAVKNLSESPDVAQNPVIQSLRTGLVSAESKLAESGQRYSKNHPEYKAAEAEVIKLRSQLDNEINRTVMSLKNSANINVKRLNDLKVQLENQKQKVLALNRDRAELDYLIKDVQLAQNALETLSNRFSQTKIEGESNQADISLLEKATPPMSASNPSMFIVLPFSLLMGFLLGCTVASVYEFAQRKVRSSDDLLAFGDIQVYAYSLASPK